MAIAIPEAGSVGRTVAALLKDAGRAASSEAPTRSAPLWPPSKSARAAPTTRVNGMRCAYR